VDPRSRSVHAVIGPESLLAEEALEAILQASLGGEREGALRVLRGEETTWSRLVDNVGMGSLFAEKRAVVVRNAEALKGEGDEITAYLDDPTPGVTLVLLAAKPDKRQKAWKRVLERAQVTPAEAPRGRALRGFAETRLRERGLKIAPDGLEELLERVGQDLRRLVGEIEKLSAYRGSGAPLPLSAEDVAAVLGRGMAQPLYKLGDAFAGRNAAQTLLLLEALLDDGEPGPKLLATLYRSLRQVRGAKALVARRASRDDMVRRLGLLPFKAQDVIQAAGRWTEEELREGLAALEAADLRMKNSLPAEIALSAAVVAACVSRRAGPPRPSPRGAR
jgi:DNA polymerase-3 subunit delta